MLLGILLVGLKAGTFDMVALASRRRRRADRTAPRCSPFVALGARARGQDARCGRCTPGCPTRTPRRPTVGSVLLAGVLLKMGTYGLVRDRAADRARTAREALAPFLGALGRRRHRLRLAGLPRPDATSSG